MKNKLLRIKITLLTIVVIILLGVLISFLSRNVRYDTPINCGGEQCMDDCYCESPFTGLAFLYFLKIIPLSPFFILLALVIDRSNYAKFKKSL